MDSLCPIYFYTVEVIMLGNGRETTSQSQNVFYKESKKSYPVIYARYPKFKSLLEWKPLMNL